jgi:hypothetical protein
MLKIYKGNYKYNYVDIMTFLSCSRLQFIDLHSSMYTYIKYRKILLLRRALWDVYIVHSLTNALLLNLEKLNLH